MKMKGQRMVVEGTSIDYVRETQGKPISKCFI